MSKCQTFGSGIFFVVDITSADDTDNADYDFLSAQSALSADEE